MKIETIFAIEENIFKLGVRLTQLEEKFEARLGAKEMSVDKNTVWTSDEIPMLSIGDGVDKNGKKKLSEFQGVFVGTEIRNIKKRATQCHRFDIGEKGEVIVFGSASINHRLAKIPSGTPVRLTYKGTKDVGGDSPMKDITVEWPKGTKLLSTMNAVPVIDDDTEE